MWDVICYDYYKAVRYKNSLEKEHDIEFVIEERSTYNTTYYLVTQFKEWEGGSMSSVYFGMRGVDDLIHEVLMRGVDVPNERTGVSTKAIFDAKVIIPEGEFPFVTNMLASPRLAFEELWFFLNCKTNTKELEEKGVNFWVGNTSREFLDTNGLDYLDEGELGSAYSNQWRNSGGYDDIYPQVYGKSQNIPSFNGGVDQLKALVKALDKDKYGRRHYVTLWNPVENGWGVLTPCWHSLQFVVLPCGNTGRDKLHLKLLNRSLDTLFGARFAIMQYRMLQMAMCKMFGFELGRLSCDLTQVHLYENQELYAQELLIRSYVDKEKSSLELNKDISCLEDLLALEWSDWSMVYDTNRGDFLTPRPDMVS